MAIIYSYPPNNNILSTDILVCTSTALVGGKPKNQTKSLSIANLSTYIITSPSNNLNQVLTNGNTSLLDAKIGELYLYDSPNSDYAKISIQDDYFSVSRATSGTTMFYVDNGYSFAMNNGTANATIINPLTVSRTYTLPDKSGTIALTSDIPAPQNLQQVVNVGNTIAVPTTVAKGIDITLANQTSVFQNGISVTIPTQTGAFPTYNPAPDAFVANINGQTPGTLIGSVVGFLANATNDDNIGFFADLTATSGTSRGFEVSSFDAHTGDYFVARKYIVGTDSVVFKVANNGDVTANSITTTIDSTISGVTIGKGGGAITTNTALGRNALFQNVAGTQTTAIGNLALNANTANNNTAVGFKAMTTNTTGNTNTSVGSESLQTNLSGNENSAFGYRALYLATSTVRNNAVGRLALGNIITGNQNVGIGVNAGLVTPAGAPNTTSDFSVYIGNDTKPSLDNNQNEIVIGYNAAGLGSNTVVLGNTNILTTRLRGTVQGASFVKDGGTAAQFLMANGSTSTMPTLQQIVDAGNYSENAILIDVASAGNSGPAVSGIAGEDTGVYGASDYGWGIFGQSTYTYGIYGYSNAGFGGYFSSNGSYSLVAGQSAAKPGGGSWSVFSDSRIKENVTPYTKGLADILLINTVTYEYNGLAGTTKGAKYTGVIAQEMKEIFPETVSTYKAKLNKEDEEKTELYDFNSSDLTFALINAVKELKAEIEILKAK